MAEHYHRLGQQDWDPTDAVAAARAALSGEASVTPKARNGPLEQMLDPVNGSSFRSSATHPNPESAAWS